MSVVASVLPPPPPVFTVGTPGGIPLHLLGVAVQAQVASGDARLVLDLRQAGWIGRRAVGTLLYGLALCGEAGGSLALRLTTDQRAAFASYPPLLLAEEPYA